MSRGFRWPPVAPRLSRAERQQEASRARLARYHESPGAIVRDVPLMPPTGGAS